MYILLVDDDEIIIEDIKSSVNWKKLGITRVESAYNVNQAREILEKKPVDIVVSDIEMPGKSGLSLLQWYREKGLQGKFLLLTSHENFDYAFKAIRFHAEEYLMKPFNVEAMEMVLQKMLIELQKEREQEKTNALGQWMLSNIREMRLNLWHRLVNDNTGTSYKKLEQELKNPDLQIDVDASYSLVISRITNMEQDAEAYGNDLLDFMLMNIQAEVFFGTPENENILRYQYPGYVILVVICQIGDTGGTHQENELHNLCGEMMRLCGKLLSTTLTCCIMNPCKPLEFRETYTRGVQLLERCVAFYGEVFSEEHTKDYLSQQAPALQMQLMEEFLNRKAKKEFMMYLKKELEARIKTKQLDSRMLENIRRETQQVVYAHLANQGIQISLLVNDKISEQLFRKAGQSALDMLRYENYLLDKIFEYEEELEQSKGLIEKINDYISVHYAEDIGRNEIGAEFYLVPEYLSKLYKKKTGMKLKDYINEYRIEQAKILLQKEDESIGEVAIKTGFDNLSYFSTLFKKSTGMTPVEYRKKSAN